MNQRERYRQITEEASSHVMDPDIVELTWAFKDYISVYKEVALGDFCPFYSSVASEQAGIEEFLEFLLNR